MGEVEWFWKQGNYLPMCFTCHNVVTGKFDKKFAGEETVTEKIKWMNGTRASNQLRSDEKFPKVKIVPFDKDKK